MKIFLWFFGFYSFVFISLLGVNNVAVGAINAGNKATIDITATVLPSCTIVAGDVSLQITNFSKTKSYSGATTISVLILGINFHAPGILIWDDPEAWYNPHESS